MNIMGRLAVYITFSLLLLIKIQLPPKLVTKIHLFLQQTTLGLYVSKILFEKQEGEFASPRGAKLLSRKGSQADSYRERVFIGQFSENSQNSSISN